MAQAEFREVLSVDREKLFSVIEHYEDYPQFVDGCEAVSVERLSDEVIRVHYKVNIMSQDVRYTLDHKGNRETGKLEWSLVESNFFKRNKGCWELKPAGTGKTDVLYSLEIEFKVPVPGFILNKLVKNSLPGMVKSFEKQARSS